MAPKQKSRDAGNSDIPKKSYKMLPLGEKVKVLDITRKGKKNLMVKLLRSTVRTNLSVKLPNL